LYRNIDIAGIKAVNDVNAAIRGKSMVLMVLMVLYINSLLTGSVYFAIPVDNSTDCKMITINK
jgi:hypothetical protein